MAWQSARVSMSVMRLISASVLLVGSAAPFAGLISGIRGGTTTCLLLGVDVSERALVGGVNGLVGGVLEGTMHECIVVLDMNIVLSAVEGKDGIGLTCFGEVNTCSHLHSSIVLTFFCLGDWKR